MQLNNFKRGSALVKIIFWREFNTQYRRTILGPLWALLSPAAYLTVFIFFRLLFGLTNPEGVPMIPFLFAGLTLWLLFAGVVNSAFPAITNNVSILKKISISPLLFIFSGMLMPLLTCGIYIILLEIVLVVYGYYPTAAHLAIPLVILLTLAFSVGVGLLVASVAFYRQDIVQLLPTVLQLGMFATPIFFSASIVPEELRWVMEINPMADCVALLRHIIFVGTLPDIMIIGKCLLVIVALWAVALPMFKRTSKYVADMY